MIGEHGEPSNREVIMLEAVDEGLKNLGESAKFAIYFYLENDYSIKKNEIPHRLEDFSQAIEKIFGQGRAAVERLILQALCMKLNVNYQTVKYTDLRNAVEYVLSKHAEHGGS